MVRKTLKRKRRSCPICKPNKTGGSSRWNPKEERQLRSDEREIRKHTRY